MDEPLREKAVLMDGARMERTLTRMAHEILERHPRLEGTVLVGVRSRGVPLARRLARAIGKESGAAPPVGALDIGLYRDDFTTIAPQPITKGTEIPFTIDGRTVVLVDDVLYTGRTVRCALDGGRLRPARAHRAGRARGPGPSRAAHPGRLRGSHHRNRARGDGAGAASRGGRARRGGIAGASRREAAFEGPQEEAGPGPAEGQEEPGRPGQGRPR